jgi:hypothetical protein
VLHVELADVVHPGGVVDDRSLLGGEAHLLGNEVGVGAHAPGMLG